MSEARLNESAPARRSGFLKRMGIYTALIFAAFLLGLVPMLVRERARTRELEAAQRELRLHTMQNHLAAAAIDARRGEYEPARQSASSFFTMLRAEVDAGETSALSPTGRADAQLLLNQRDDLITLLARNDPAATDRLLDMYASFRRTAGTAQLPRSTP